MKNVRLPDIRKAVTDCIGNRVIVRSNKGRQKYDINEGVIKEVYPHIFMIELDSEEEAGKMVSYTYSDILTKDVQLRFCNP